MAHVHDATAVRPLGVKYVKLQAGGDRCKDIGLAQMESHESHGSETGFKRLAPLTTRE